LNNSFNKSKNKTPNVSYNEKIPIGNVNTTRLINKINHINLIPNNISKEKTNGYSKIANKILTPPKYTDFLKFKLLTINKNQNIKSNKNTNNTSLNNSINNNSCVLNTPIKKGLLTSNAHRNKLSNVSENQSVGKPIKNANDKSRPPHTARNENNNFKIPIDKNSYKEKYKNININFYQNTIINENNKRKASENSDTNPKDLEDKLSNYAKIFNSNSKGF